MVRVEAIVLRHSDWGEADRLLWLITQEMGKIQAVAKGVRRIRSRKAGHLEPFTRASLLLARGRDLLIVTQAETIDAFLPLARTWPGLRMPPTWWSCWIGSLTSRGKGASFLCCLPIRSSGYRRGQIHDSVIRYFELRLLDQVGFRPELFNCLGCSREIKPESQFFSAKAGGVLCPKCGPGAPGAIPISINALHLLRHFQRSSFSEAMRLGLSAEVNREVEILMQHYLTYLLERGLNTPPFLRRLRSAAQDAKA